MDDKPSAWIECPICRQQNSFGGVGHWAWHNHCRAELNPVAFVQWLQGMDDRISGAKLKAGIIAYVAMVTGMDTATAMAALDPDGTKTPVREAERSQRVQAMQAGTESGVS